MVGDCPTSVTEYSFKADGTATRSVVFMLADAVMARDTVHWTTRGDTLYIGTSTATLAPLEKFFPIKKEDKQLLIADGLFFKTSCGDVVGDSYDTINLYEPGLGDPYKKAVVPKGLQ